MELSGFLKIARRWALVLVGAAFLSGVAGLLASRSGGVAYRATTQLLVGPFSGDFQQLRAAASLAETYAELVVSTRVLEAAAGRAGETLPPSTLRRSVSARANDLTRILSISVTHPRSDLAADLANGLADELIKLSRENRPSTEEARESPVDSGSLRVVEEATPPTSAVSSGGGLTAAMAALAGFGTVFIIAVAFETLGGRLREPNEVEKLTGAPCIPITPRHRRRAFVRRRRPIPGAYRIVTVALDKSDKERARTIAVAPTDPGGAADDVAIRVAEAFAASGQEVVVVDADSSCSLTRRLGLVGVPGLSDFFIVPKDGPNRLAALRMPTSIPGLSVLPAGTSVLSLDHDQALKAQQHLLNEVDRVVLASGSPIVDSHSLVWARVADAVLLITSSDRTRRTELDDATRALQLAGAKLTATVLLQ